MSNKNDSILKRKQLFLNSVAKFCDKCGTEYSPEDINIVQNTEISAIIHFNCRSCKSKNIATFAYPLGISSRTPVNTDLHVKEIKKFAGKGEVSLEEILQIYVYLKENSKIDL